MPRTPATKTLKDACLHNIARNMDNYWCADYIKNYLDQGNFLYVIGPFELLPSSLTEALLEVLSRTNRLKRHHLHLLVDQKLTHLDLSSLKPVANSNTIARMVTQRCKNLKRVNMACCDQISGRDLCEFATQMPNLISLDVSGTKFSDQGCAILSHYCPNLQELNISRCPVSDSGMISLCTTFADDKKKCPKLRKLDISSTMVGLKGVQEVLTNLPDIQWFVHPLAFMAVGFLQYENYTEGQVVATENQYKLRNLLLEYHYHNINPMHDWQQSSFPYGDDLLESLIITTIAYCPCVTHLNINFKITSDMWKALLSLQHLEYLDIDDEEGGDFNDNVFPILQRNGENLKRLNLANISNVDLDVIGATCLRLKKLVVTHGGFADYGFVQNSHPELTRAYAACCFTELTDLHLNFYQLCTPGNFNITHLLRQCKSLKNLVMMNVDFFSDEVLENVLQVNPLAHLESVSLLSCNEISGSMVSRLLFQDNDLYSLTMKGCQNITRRESDEMKKLAKNRRYELQILWD